MKKLRVLSIIFVMVFIFSSIVACAPAKTSNSDKNDGASTNTSSKGKVKINVWAEWDHPTIKQQVEKFNKEHNNIEMSYLVSQGIGNDGNGKMMSSVAAGDPPNIIIAWMDSIAMWAEKGAILPQDDIIETMGVKQEDYMKDAWLDATWNGKVYGVPIDWDPDCLLWWNKKAFKDAGLDPEKPPQTWDEMNEYAKKMTKIENGKTVSIGLVPWQGWLFNQIQLMHMFDAELKTGNDGKEVKIYSPEAVEVLEYLKSYVDFIGGVDKVAAFQSESANSPELNPFYTGKLGMILIGSWQAGGIKNYAPDMEYGVTTIPVPPGGQQYISSSGWAWVIPRGAKNMNETKEVLKFLNSDEFVTEFCTKVTGWIPAKMSLRTNPAFLEDKYQKSVIDAIKDQEQEMWLPPSPVLTEYYDKIVKATDQVVNGQKSAEQALKDAENDIQKSWKKYLSNKK